MKVLKHINFCLFLLLVILFAQNNILMAAAGNRPETKIKEQKKLNDLKKERRTSVSRISKIIADNNNYRNKEVIKNPAPIESLKLNVKSATNFQIKEKTFFETLKPVFSFISSISIFFSIIFSFFSKKSTTQEKFPMFSFLIKKIAGFGKSTVQLKRPPATFWAKIANLLPKKHRESLLQEISDMRLEYYEALKEKNIWRARFIVISYYIGFGWSVVMWISGKVKEVVGIIPKKD